RYSEVAEGKPGKSQGEAAGGKDQSADNSDSQTSDDPGILHDQALDTIEAETTPEERFEMIEKFVETGEIPELKIKALEDGSEALLDNLVHGRSAWFDGLAREVGGLRTEWAYAFATPEENQQARRAAITGDV